MSEQQRNKPDESIESPERAEQPQSEKPEVTPKPSTKRNYQRFEPNLIEISRAHQVKKVFQPVKNDDSV